MKLKTKHISFRARAIILVSFLIVVSLIIFFAYGFMTNNNSSQSSRNQDIAVLKDTKTGSSVDAISDRVVKLSAMGDMLAHDTIIANAKTNNSYDFSKFFTNIKSSYANADIVFCNQEGLSSGEDYGISGYPVFNAPKQFAYDLKNGAGCNLINLANNHIGDKGSAALGSTVDYWNELKPLGVSGANINSKDQNKVVYFEVNGIKFGFVAFADFNNNKSIPSYNVNIYHDQSLLQKLVKEARAKSDVVIVSMHWGVEDSNYVSSDQINQVGTLNSLGADIVIGTGPHVLQKAEIIKSKQGHKTVVWYSLGNMLSSQLNIKQLIGGIANMEIKLDTKNALSISKLSFTPTYMHYEWTAQEAANGDLLKRKNAMIYLLKDAEKPLQKSLFGTTITAEMQYARDTIGNQVTIE